MVVIFLDMSPMINYCSSDEGGAKRRAQKRGKGRNIKNNSIELKSNKKKKNLQYTQVLQILVWFDECDMAVQ